MDNFEQLHGKTIAEKNKELIEKIRKASNKPPQNTNLVTSLWIIVMVVVTICAIIGIYYATKPIVIDDNYTINVTVDSDDPENNQTQLQNLKFPADVVNYSLYVCNDKQSEYNIYFRFSALTFVEGVMENNILAFIMAPENASSFYYDQDQDMWYYLGYLEIKEKVNICSKVQLKGHTTDNSYADKQIGFTLIVEAVQSNVDHVWLDASAQWLELMGLN